MQISEIVLYGDGDRLRRLSLRVGQLNIITGASMTGKSALSNIIEYCLGRSECLVPAGVIADSIRWYGLLLQFPETQVFVARRAPSLGYRSSTDVYMQIGTDLEPPQSSLLTQNATPDDLSAFLTRTLGVSPNLNVPPEGQTRRPLEATIRQALFLNFQQQSEITNQRFLFHRQGEPSIPQTIKDTLPYFLGAVEEDRLLKVQQLRLAKQELRAAERKARERELLQGGGLGKGLALLAEAEQVGLVPPQAAPSDMAALLQSLQPLLEWTPQESPAIPGEALARLQEDRRRLRNEYRALKDRQRVALSCADGQNGFALEAREQQARLQSIGLYQPSPRRANVCPVCESELETPLPAVSELQQSLEHIVTQLNQVETERPRLRGYLDQIEQALTDVGQQLNENRDAISTLTTAQPVLQAQADSNSATARVVGRVSLYLESVSAPAETVESDGLERARARVRELEDQLANSSAEEMLPSILNILNQRIAHFAEQLRLEFSNDPLRLDVQSRLTVIADTLDRGPVSLERMGSGRNWIGYHLAVHMAIHEWFVQRNRPVPRFLFLDQPSQVYYPQDRDQEGSIDVLEEDDRTLVRRMFKWLADNSSALAPDFQIIVTDHADIDEPWFRDAVVERWRHGVKLVPVSWLGTEETT